jgi:hypothetical protein
MPQPGGQAQPTPLRRWTPERRLIAILVLVAVLFACAAALVMSTLMLAKVL